METLLQKRDIKNILRPIKLYISHSQKRLHYEITKLGHPSQNFVKRKKLMYIQHLSCLRDRKVNKIPETKQPTCMWN